MQHWRFLVREIFGRLGWVYYINIERREGREVYIHDHSHKNDPSTQDHASEIEFFRRGNRNSTSRRDLRFLLISDIQFQVQTGKGKADR